MTLDKINTYAYKTVCILFIAFLLLGSLGLILHDHAYVKGYTGATAAALIIWLMTRPVTLQAWLYLLGLLLVTFYIIGAISNNL